MGQGNGILWLSFVLIMVVVFTVYRPVLSRLLFDPTFGGSGTGFPQGQWDPRAAAQTAPTTAPATKVMA